MVGLPLWLNVALLAAAGCGGVLDGRRLASATTAGDPFAQILPRARYIYLLVGALGALLAALGAFHVAPELLWHLPLWLEWLLLPTLWGALLVHFAFLWSLAATVAFRARHRQRWALVVSGVLLVAVVEIAHHQYSRPIAPELSERRSSTGVVLQSSGASCAAASGANLIRLLGGPRVTERQVAAALGTTASGTSASQVVYGLRAFGLGCRRVQVANAAPAALLAPSMIFVDHPLVGEESHAVVFVRLARRGAGAGEARVELWDPLYGARLLRVAELRRVWHGRAVHCRWLVGR